MCSLRVFPHIWDSGDFSTYIYFLSIWSHFFLVIEILKLSLEFLGNYSHFFYIVTPLKHCIIASVCLSIWCEFGAGLSVRLTNGRWAVSLFLPFILVMLAVQRWCTSALKRPHFLFYCIEACVCSVPSHEPVSVCVVSLQDCRVGCVQIHIEGEHVAVWSKKKRGFRIKRLDLMQITCYSYFMQGKRHSSE